MVSSLYLMGYLPASVLFRYPTWEPRWGDSNTGLWTPGQRWIRGPLGRLLRVSPGPNAPSPLRTKMALLTIVPLLSKILDSSMMWEYFVGHTICDGKTDRKKFKNEVIYGLSQCNARVTAPHNVWLYICAPHCCWDFTRFCIVHWFCLLLGCHCCSTSLTMGCIIRADVLMRSARCFGDINVCTYRTSVALCLTGYRRQSGVFLSQYRLI